MDKDRKEYNIIEKITFVFGALVIIVLLAYLIFQTIKKDKKEPPQIEVTSHYVSEMDHYSFRLKIENTGGITAEEVNIQLKLYQDGIETETETITIQYVPMKSVENAWVIFHTKRNPTDSLVVSSISYIQP